MAADLNLRAFLDGGDAARAGEEWLQSHITPTMRAEWPENMARIVRHQCGGDNHMAVLWRGPSPLASYTVLRDDFNRSKLLLWERNAGVPPSAEAQQSEYERIHSLAHAWAQECYFKGLGRPARIDETRIAFQKALRALIADGGEN